MVKGVNRRIIEVSSTGSEYFEKAILYIRPNCSEISDKLIAEEARCFLSSLGAKQKPPQRSADGSKKQIVLLCAIIVVTALIIMKTIGIF